MPAPAKCAGWAAGTSAMWPSTGSGRVKRRDGRGASAVLLNAATVFLTSHGGHMRPPPPSRLFRICLSCSIKRVTRPTRNALRAGNEMARAPAWSGRQAGLLRIAALGHSAHTSAPRSKAEAGSISSLITHAARLGRTSRATRFRFGARFAGAYRCGAFYHRFRNSATCNQPRPFAALLAPARSASRAPSRGDGARAHRARSRRIVEKRCRKITRARSAA